MANTSFDVNALLSSLTQFEQAAATSANVFRATFETQVAGLSPVFDQTAIAATTAFDTSALSVGTSFSTAFAGIDASAATCASNFVGNFSSATLLLDTGCLQTSINIGSYFKVPACLSQICLWQPLLPC